MGAKTQANGILHLDEFDSMGERGREVHLQHRLLALSSRDDVWYGFILTRCDPPIVMPGHAGQVGVAFLNDEGARAAFSGVNKIRIGDGVRERGTLVIDGFVGDDD